MARYVVILSLAPGAACADDDKSSGADAGKADRAGTQEEAGAPDPAVAQKEAGAPDQVVREQGAGDRGAGDAATGGDASAPSIKTNTVNFIKVLANKLPAGATTNEVEKFVPTDAEARPWAEDSSAGPRGVQSAYTDKDIENVINGHHAPFAEEGKAGFAKEDCKTGKDTLQLFLWEMNKAASAGKLVADFKAEYTSSWGLTFQNIAGGKDLAIIADDSPNGRVFGYKGKYIYEVTSTRCSRA